MPPESTRWTYLDEEHSATLLEWSKQVEPTVHILNIWTFISDSFYGKKIRMNHQICLKKNSPFGPNWKTNLSYEPHFRQGFRFRTTKNPASCPQSIGIRVLTNNLLSPFLTSALLLNPRGPLQIIAASNNFLVAHGIRLKYLSTGYQYIWPPLFKAFRTLTKTYRGKKFNGRNYLLYDIHIIWCNLRNATVLF